MNIISAVKVSSFVTNFFESLTAPHTYTSYCTDVVPYNNHVPPRRHVSCTNYNACTHTHETGLVNRRLTQLQYLLSLLKCLLSLLTWLICFCSLFDILCDLSWATLSVCHKVTASVESSTLTQRAEECPAVVTYWWFTACLRAQK